MPKNKRSSKTPYQKIRDASERGTPVVLTQKDIDELMKNEIIVQKAEMDDD